MKPTGKQWDSEAGASSIGLAGLVSSHLGRWQRALGRCQVLNAWISHDNTEIQTWKVASLSNRRLAELVEDRRVGRVGPLGSKSPTATETTKCRLHTITCLQTLPTLVQATKTWTGAAVTVPWIGTASITSYILGTNSALDDGKPQRASEDCANGLGMSITSEWYQDV